jgi:hypothetical protein
MYTLIMHIIERTSRGMKSFLGGVWESPGKIQSPAGSSCRISGRNPAKKEG